MSHDTTNPDVRQSSAMQFSSFPYTLVRDFAYSAGNPLHYGPPPTTSTPPTPTSGSRRLSDPPASWDQKMPWDSWTPDGFSRGHDIPPIQFGDGPPYSEDEDLQSPVVATRHRKNKSASNTMGSSRQAGNQGSVLAPVAHEDGRGYYTTRAGDGRERYYVREGGEANGPGGDLITYPAEKTKHTRAYHYSQMQETLEGGSEGSGSASPYHQAEDQSRYSRDYQFTITSPDEEFHGKAVALFDFKRENENELPLAEGQIIWVSYRHGQGWLVAEDPKTQESGLVPEEYVRLLRDIEGGMNSLTGPGADNSGSPKDPVVSMFSTSSKDLKPYPTEQLHQGQVPPQVVHYQGQRGGSQINTPTGPNSQDEETSNGKEGSQPAVVAEGASQHEEATRIKPDSPTSATSSKHP